MHYDELLVIKDCAICKGQPLHLFFEIYKNGFSHESEKHGFVYSHRSIWYCRTCLGGFIESYSHDCFQRDEPWDTMAWFALDPLDLVILEKYIRDCPNCFDPLCECPAHRHLQDSFENIMQGPHKSLTLETPRVFYNLIVDRVNERPSFRQTERSYFLYSGTLFSKSELPD